MMLAISNRCKASILGATNVTVEGYKVFNAVSQTSSGFNSATDFNGVIDPVGQPGFYGQCNNVGVCTGTLINFVQTSRRRAATAQGKFSSISSSVLHHGAARCIELDNDDPSVNNGDITVASSWNLGAGFAGYLVSSQAFPGEEGRQPFPPAR